MIGEIVLAVLSFATGWAIPKVLGLHAHKYSVVLHKPLNSFANLGGITHTKASGENYVGQNYDAKNTFVTCKQCNVCQHKLVRISDGSDRTFNFDEEFVLTHIDTEMKKEEAKKEEELLTRMNDLLKTPEQREAEAKIKATEDETKRAQLQALKEATDAQIELAKQQKLAMMNAKQSPSDEILERLKNGADDVRTDHSGNIIYVAHRADGDDVHIIKKKKTRGGRLHG